MRRSSCGAAWGPLGAPSARTALLTLAASHNLVMALQGPLPLAHNYAEQPTQEVLHGQRFINFLGLPVEEDESNERLALISSHHMPVDEKPDRELTLSDAMPGLLMATLAGLSTTLGALVIFCMPVGGPSPKAMAFALSLAGGVMIAVSVEMVAPDWHGDEGGHDHGHGHGHHKSWWWAPLLFILGGLTTFIFCKLGDLLHRCASPSSASSESSGPEPVPHGVSSGSDDWKEGGSQKKYKWRLAVLLFFSLTAHNFPEGFAVAISALSSKQLGILICVAIACHNIPEGIAIAVTTYDATKSRAKAVLMTFVSGLSEPIGALCAILFLQHYLTPALLNDLLTLVAGVMCYIAVFELIPEAYSTRQWLWLVAGFVTGIAVMVGTHLALEYVFEHDHLGVHHDHDHEHDPHHDH